MEVRVNYKCPSTGIAEQVRLCIDDWDSKTLYDVKEAIQTEIRAPMCDQELIYQGRLLDNNSSPLKNLYFRQGDEFEVRFPSEVDLNEIQELLNDLKQFRLRVCTNQNSLLQITREDLASDYSPLDYMDVTRALELLAFRFCSPWKTAKSLANRRFFVQDGGLDIFMAIFKFSFKHYSDGTQESDEPGETEKRQLDSQMIVATLRFLNAEQTHLLVSCLTFLWNFSETGQDRKLIIEKGVLPLATEALLLDPYGEYYFDPLSELRDLMIEVNEQAIGCVAGCVEFDANAQETVVNNDEAIAKVVAMMDRTLAKTGALTMFCSQLASNSLFYCTFNVKTHSLFVQKGLLQRVLTITKTYLDIPGGDMVLRYYCCLVLARLSSSPAVELEKETVETIDKLINGFLDIHKPSEMLVWEKDHFYVWVTLVPMIHLAFACGPPGRQNGNRATTDEVGSSHTAKWRKINDEKEQEMEIEFDSCGARTAEGTSHFQCEYACKNAAEQQGMIRNGADSSSTESAMNTTDEMCEIKEEYFPEKGKHELSSKLADEVPQKNNIDFNNSDSEIFEGTLELGRWPGSVSVRRLGLFALSYLLCLEENRQLIRSEGMLGYLVCLSWHLRPEERDQLQEQLNKFPDVKAPSLKILTKSFLARMHGLQTVFRM